jgi:hypothetical protein
MKKRQGLQDVDVDGRKAFKWILKKQDRKVCSG